MSFAHVCRFVVLAGIFIVTLTMAGQPTPPPAATDDAAKIAALIKNLNAADNLKREEAERDLLAIGQAALPALKEAVKSPELETALRAKKLVSKLTERASRPGASYAEVLPATSIFMLEAANARQTLDKLKNSPLGKFWDLPASQKFYKGHWEAQVPNDQKLLDAVRELPKLADGRALFALGDPSTAEMAELDPPLLYLLETKQAQALERAVRSLFEGISDAPRANRQYGPFTIEEHITAQSVFGQESVLHSLTQAGVEGFLNYMIKRPETALTTKLADIRAAHPNFDFTYYLSRDGFDELADAGQLVDSDQVKMLDAIGFSKGSALKGVIAVTPDGFEEHMLFTIGDPAKAESLLNIVRQLPVAPPPAAPNAAQALDLIPWQAAIVMSLNAEVSKNAVAVGRALRAWDALTAPPKPKPEIKPTETGVQPNQPLTPVKPVAPPNPNEKPVEPKKTESKTIGKEALVAGGGEPAKPKEDKPPVAADEAKEPPVYPHIAKFEQSGIKLEQLLEQISGPLQVAFFLHTIEGDVAPDYNPVAPLIAMVLKDAKGIEQALEASCAGANPRFSREVLNGGTHYIDKFGDPDLKSGFWLKANYLAYSVDRELLDLAGLALAHKNGNERMADRASYKQALAAKRINTTSALTIFGDADQVLEVPYKLAGIAWQEDTDNPWPTYDMIRPLLKDKPFVLDIKATPEGFKFDAQTPLTLFGMMEAYRRPLKETGF